MQGQPPVAQDRTRLCDPAPRNDKPQFGARRAARPPLRILSRRIPIPRGPEPSDDYSLAADRCSLGFRAASREVACLELGRRRREFPATKSPESTTSQSPAETKHTHYYAPDEKHRRW